MRSAFVDCPLLASRAVELKTTPRLSKREGVFADTSLLISYHMRRQNPSHPCVEAISCIYIAPAPFGFAKIHYSEQHNICPKRCHYIASAGPIDNNII
jgi:hypothetical protein